MKKYLAFLILAGLLAGQGMFLYPGQKDDLSGTWTGYAERQGSRDPLTVVFEIKDKTYTGTLTDEMGMFQGAAIKNFVRKAETVTFEFEGGMGSEVFTLKAELKLKGDTITGTWVMVGAEDSGSIELARKK
jgi:hypothetical protein